MAMLIHKKMLGWHYDNGSEIAFNRLPKLIAYFEM